VTRHVVPLLISCSHRLSNLSVSVITFSFQGDTGRDGGTGEMGPEGRPGPPAPAPLFAPAMMMMGGGSKGGDYMGDEPEAVRANHEFYRMYEGE